MDNILTKRISDYPTVIDPSLDDIIPTVHLREDGVKVNRNITYSTLADEARGAQGIQGPIGETGPIGPTGAASTVPGPTGPQGPIGLTGAKGDTGAASTVPGPTGPIGNNGPQGVQGIKGDKGADGAAGVKGDTGATGATGAASTVPGPTGPKGDTGLTGATGAASTVPGPKGDTGATGPKGDTGLKGDKGDVGDPGPAGSGAGDMLASMYDPGMKYSSAFSMDNMDETATKKILTSAERSAISANTAKVGITPTQASNITANNAKISFDSTSSTRLANTSGTNTGDNATNTQYSGLAASKQATLVNTTNIKSVNGTSLLGSGNLVVGGAVDSVNTKTGAVVLTQDDIASGTTNKAYTAAEQTKLSGIEASANNYSLPTASTSVLGGVKVDGSTINITGGVISSAAVGGVSSVAGKTGAVTLDKTDVGLSDVDNTTDVGKPVSTATTTALNLKANLASPTFTGTVTVPTPATTTAAATKAYVDTTRTVAQGGTGRTTSTTAYGVLTAGTTATGAHQTVSPGTTGQVLISNGTAALPTFQSGVVKSATTAKVTTGTTTPVGPATGDLWFDTNTLPEDLAPSSIVWKETPGGIVNGSNTAFTTAQAYVSATLQVFVNGVAQSGLVTETSPTGKTFAVSPAPLTGDNLSIQYQVRVTATGNADTVDGYHASSTPTANTIPVLDGSGLLPVAALPSNTLGFVETATGVSTTSTSPIQMSGMSVTVTVPSGGKRVRATLSGPTIESSGAYFTEWSIWDGAVGSGTKIGGIFNYGTAAPGLCIGSHVPSAGSHTYNAGIKTTAGTGYATAAVGSTLKLEIEIA